MRVGENVYKLDHHRSGGEELEKSRELSPKRPWLFQSNPQKPDKLSTIYPTYPQYCGSYPHVKKGNFGEYGNFIHKYCQKMLIRLLSN